MSQNFHASVEYCCPIWLVKANNTHVGNTVIEHSRRNPSIRLYSIVFHVWMISICPFFCFHRLLTRPSRVKWGNSIPPMHGSFGTFTMPFLKGQNMNSSIDRSFTNQNRNLTWPLCCPCGAHSLHFNVLSFVVCVCCCPSILNTPLVFSNSSLYNRHDQFSR
jgi:hypothetical protein